MSLTLYYHPLASFCHKVLIALYENETTFDKRPIDLGNADDRAELAAVWPLCKFPVLRDHARKQDIAETSIIIEYLDQHYPGRNKLIPPEPAAALDVRLWDRIFDDHVQGPMQNVVFDKLGMIKTDAARERAALSTAYGMIDRQLGSHDWVCGEDFSMADCAAAPALFYAATIMPFDDAHTALHGYFDRLMDRASVKRVIDEARPYFSMYPFAEVIPARFR